MNRILQCLCGKCDRLEQYLKAAALYYKGYRKGQRLLWWARCLSRVRSYLKGAISV